VATSVWGMERIYVNNLYKFYRYIKLRTLKMILGPMLTS